MQRQTGSSYVKKIDYVFYSEGAIKLAVDEIRKDNSHYGKNGSGVSDPTAAEVIRNTTPILSVLIGDSKLERPEEWLRVINATYAWCDRDRFIVAKDRYAGIDYRQTCAKLTISTAQYFRWLYDVRHFAALCAAQMGLIKVC